MDNGHAAILQTLPDPGEEALAVSTALGQRIQDEIEANAGAISFACFMELALYEPGLGYYSAGQNKFGEQGDFVTAPEISSLFSICLARQCAEVLEAMQAPQILELGAGQGTMACDILLELARRDCLPERYMILETSADLRQRQYALLSHKIPEHLSRVTWLDALPGAFPGIILANEVLDALPVERFIVREEKIAELCVTRKDDGFDWLECDAATELEDRVREIQRHSVDAFPAGYRSEINRMLPAWLKSLADCLERGMLLFIDYGYSRHEYYHEQRVDGTLVCHYRHRAHADPFLYPGLQDISASVEFTAVAEAAVKAGLSVQGYTTQAFFLLACGIEQLMHESASDSGQARMELARQVKLLTLPAEMGERFKVMALTRDLTRPLSGFSVVDHRHRL